MRRSHEEELADALSALAHPGRIRLIRTLRAPKTLSEIDVPAASEDERARALSRQAVRKHLDKLIENGYVRGRETERSRGATTEYVLDHQRLFALSEEFRGLARLRPTAEPESPTTPAREVVGAREERPCLLLAKGPDEGRSFSLMPPGPEGGWTIGRRRNIAVSLDFDPFASSENSVVSWDGDAHVLRDLPTSRNGTLHNFVPLPRGGSARLRHGDIVGVGRSLLVYWSDRG